MTEWSRSHRPALNVSPTALSTWCGGTARLRVSYGSIDVVRELLDSGVDVNQACMQNPVAKRITGWQNFDPEAVKVDGWTLETKIGHLTQEEKSHVDVVNSESLDTKEAELTTAYFLLANNNGVVYWELEIIDAPANEPCNVTVGVAVPQSSYQYKLGTLPGTYGYVGATGHTYSGLLSSRMMYSSKFGKGDTIGVIWNKAYQAISYTNNTAYRAISYTNNRVHLGIAFRNIDAYRAISYTKNGVHLGIAFRNIDVADNILWASVGVEKQNVKVKASFLETQGQWKANLDEVLYTEELRNNTGDMPPWDHKSQMYPLHFSVCRNDVRNIEDVDGWTPLHKAAFNGWKEGMELLIAKGADVNAETAFKSFPLLFTVLNSHTEATRGRTLLMIAASIGNTSIMDMLLKHKAELKARDKHGKTAMQYACNEQTALFLEKALQQIETYRVVYEINQQTALFLEKALQQIETYRVVYEINQQTALFLEKALQQIKTYRVVYEINQQMARHTELGLSVAIKFHQDKASRDHSFRILQDLSSIYCATLPSSDHAAYCFDDHTAYPETPFALVTYGGEQDLYDFLEENGQGNIAENQCRYIFECIASSVHHMHVKGYVHHDLKPKNVVRFYDGRYRLIDFETTRRVQSNGVTTTTAAYAAPEVASHVLSHQGMMCSQYYMDIWALGCILFQIMAKQCLHECLFDGEELRHKWKDCSNQNASNKHNLSLLQALRQEQWPIQECLFDREELRHKWKDGSNQHASNKHNLSLLQALRQEQWPIQECLFDREELRHKWKDGSNQHASNKHNLSLLQALRQEQWPIQECLFDREELRHKWKDGSNQHASNKHNLSLLQALRQEQWPIQECLFDREELRHKWKDGSNQHASKKHNLSLLQALRQEQRPVLECLFNTKELRHQWKDGSNQHESKKHNLSLLQALRQEQRPVRECLFNGEELRHQWKDGSNQNKSEKHDLSLLQALRQEQVDRAVKEYVVDRAVEEYVVDRAVEEYVVDRTVEEYVVDRAVEEYVVDRAVEEYVVKKSTSHKLTEQVASLLKSMLKVTMDAKALQGLKTDIKTMHGKVDQILHKVIHIEERTLILADLPGMLQKGFSEMGSQLKMPIRLKGPVMDAAERPLRDGKPAENGPDHDNAANQGKGALSGMLQKGLYQMGSQLKIVLTMVMQGKCECPSTFVVLPDISPKEMLGSGKSGVTKMKKWIGLLGEAYSSPNTIQHLAKKLGRQQFKLFLKCETCFESQGTGYTIETAAEWAVKLLPAMQFAFVAGKAYNVAASIGRMFFPFVPCIPDEMLQSAIVAGKAYNVAASIVKMFFPLVPYISDEMLQSRVETTQKKVAAMEEKSRTFDPDDIQAVVSEAEAGVEGDADADPDGYVSDDDPERMTEEDMAPDKQADASLRQLRMFLKDTDPQNNWGGLSCIEIDKTIDGQTSEVVWVCAQCLSGQNDRCLATGGGPAPTPGDPQSDSAFTQLPTTGGVKDRKQSRSESQPTSNQLKELPPKPSRGSEEGPPAPDPTAKPPVQRQRQRSNSSPGLLGCFGRSSFLPPRPSEASGCFGRSSVSPEPN
eukprot:gene12285-15437_t